MYRDSAVKQAGKPRILVAPLDWGLGHATRCIPLVYEMLRQNADVWLAGEGAQESLLRQEFPSLPFFKIARVPGKIWEDGGWFGPGNFFAASKVATGN